ncbi:MAG: hypothetical protein J1E60_02165 [Christensenellaceae bacterium]|nr:hypothetical protein [Christensenellaceae bacterium]
MDMRALYYIALPLEREKTEDARNHEADIKANENCLNQNFALIAEKIYEFETRLLLLEAALAELKKDDTERT